MTHVDASKKSVEAGKANAFLSDMADRPIRWMVDDAAKFAAREVRREKRYDGIFLDPAQIRAWAGWRGVAAGGRPARPDRRLPSSCSIKDSKFLVLTVYAVRMSALAIGEVVRQALADLGGTVEVGEMAVREEARGLVAADRDLRALVAVDADAARRTKDQHAAIAPPRLRDRRPRSGSHVLRRSRGRAGELAT